MPPTIILVGADKGGVGKTHVTRALLDYFEAMGVKSRVFDTQSPNGDLKRFAPAAEVIDIGRVQDQMKVFDGVADDVVTVVDICAGLLSPTIKALDEAQLLNDVRHGNMRLELLHVLGPTISSITEIDAASRALGPAARYYLVKNHINDTEFFEWQGGPARAVFEKTRDITIDVHKLDVRACEEMQARGGSFFDFATSTASRTLRGLVSTWLDRVWNEFDRVGVYAAGDAPPPSEEDQAMDNVFVKPRTIDGKPAMLRDPGTGKPLDAGGEWKPNNQFWARRIAQGDVVDDTKAQMQRQAAPAAKPAPAPAPAPGSTVASPGPAAPGSAS